MNIDKLIEINQNLDLLPFSVLDGVTDFSTFESSSMKILWILKEANQDPEKGPHKDDLTNYHRNVTTYKNWRRTYKMIIKTSYGLLNNKNYEDIPNEGIISDVMSQIAYINVKKTGGTSKSSYYVILNAYRENKAILLEQIEAIEPEIIINASGIEELSNTLAISEWKQVEAFKVAKAENAIIIHVFHPNQRQINHPTYYGLIKKSIEWMKEN
jgi:hypothetical protein